MAECFCEAIPTIYNQTDILILQHVKERFHAFNTARIVRKALNNCRLLVDQTPALATADVRLNSRAGVLYPGDDSMLLSDISDIDRPQQLVILDGTWHHARTLMREIPWLQKLPRFCLRPKEPSTYRIRREPTETALSTIEATVQALRILEPQTDGFKQLLAAFTQMVEGQLKHPVRAARIRKRSALPRPSVNIPSALLHTPENIIVAYGETSFGGINQDRDNQTLVYWTARRLVSEESFETAIQPPHPLSPEFLQHLQLTEVDFRNAVSPTEFAAAWNDFVRPDDVLCVFNETTARALAKHAADVLPVISLKSVNMHRDCRTLDDILAVIDVEPKNAAHHGRAAQRLANAVAYARYLQKTKQ